MGFSVSGSFAILAVAGFVAFGMMYTAGSNEFERVTDASTSTHEDALNRQNTAIDIVHLEYTTGTLEANVTNDGTTTLDVNATDLIVDGDYHATDDFDELYVDNRSGTYVWLPGERLTVRIQLPDLTTPARVKVVTEYGIADAEVVS